MNNIYKKISILLFQFVFDVCEHDGEEGEKLRSLLVKEGLQGVPGKLIHVMLVHLL